MDVTKIKKKKRRREIRKITLLYRIKAKRLIKSINIYSFLSDLFSVLIFLFTKTGLPYLMVDLLNVMISFE